MERFMEKWLEPEIPCKAIYLPRMYLKKSECPTRMEQAKEAAKQLIRQTAEFLPGSRIGLLFSGSLCTQQTAGNSQNQAYSPFLKEISDFGNEFGEGYCYAEALSKVQEMIEELQVLAESCSLITITAGEAGSEKKEDPSGSYSGGSIYASSERTGSKESCVLFDGQRQERRKRLVSPVFGAVGKPLPGVLSGQLLEEMDRLFPVILQNSTTVSVVQALDPRFQLTEKEYARLSQEEVSVIEKENGETLIALGGRTSLQQ